MKLYTDYLPFETDDFLTDPVFREWVARPTPEVTAYWQGLLKTYPQLRGSFDQAHLLAQGMQATWTPFSDRYTDALYHRLSAVLSADASPASISRVKRFIPRWAYASVASLLLVIGLSGNWYFFQEQVIQTGNAELTTATLYDGSVVTLNANSQLRLPSRIAWHKQRQVWLSGEASFAVRRQAGEKASSFHKFTVHTHRDDVVVLGTHFTIYTRPLRTLVLLEEGRITLTNPTTHKTQAMQPGQVAAYTDRRLTSKIDQLAPEQQRPLTAWRENRLLFNNASMPELAQRFQEVYGVKLIIGNDAFAGQEFRGELPVDDFDKALLIISETFSYKPIRQGNEVYFVPK